MLRLVQICLIKFSFILLFLSFVMELRANDKYPDCDKPESVLAYYEEVDKLIHVNWQGEQAEERVTFFEVHYRNVNHNDWLIELVKDGPNSISISAQDEGDWLIKIRRICIDEMLGNHESEFVQVRVDSIEKGGEEEYCDDLLNPIAYAAADGIIVEWELTAALTALGTNFLVEICLEESKASAPTCYQVPATALESFFGGFAVGDEYSVTIGLVIPGPGGLSVYNCPTTELGPIPIIHDDTSPNEDPPPITLPAFSCGDEFTLPNVDPSQPLPTAQADDIFFVGGFPVLLQTVTGGTGVFTGTGVVPLPFTEQVISVEFTGVKVNKDHEIYEGQVIAIADDPANYPVIPTGPVSIGGEICIPNPIPGFDDNGVYQPGNSPTDPNGFGPTGTYDVEPPYIGYDPNNPNTPFDPNYDPNGFDVNGVHQATGTTFNENGCSQDSLTVDGQPCSPAADGPYDWLPTPSTTTPTVDGIAFADSVKNDLRPLIIAGLSAILTEAQDSVQQTSDYCNGARDDVKAKIADLGHDQDFIVGEQEAYIKEGSYANFKQRPTMLLNNDTRNPAQVALEQRHIDVFDCDKRLYMFLAWRTLITEHQTEQEIDDFEVKLTETISAFTAEQVAIYSDSTAFVEWVKIEVDNIIYNQFLFQYGVEFGLGFNNYQSIPKLRQPVFIVPALDPYSSPLYATRDNLPLETALTREDISFFFRQGFKEVNGLHRAYYLESMVNQRITTSLASADHLLPVELSKVVAGRTYTLYLDNIVFDPQGATLDIFFIFEPPQGGNKLVFEMTGVAFGPTGFPADLEAKLSLVSNIEIRLNNTAQLNIIGAQNNSKTFVAFDCDGFAGMGIEAEIEFCRDKIIPLDPQTLENNLPDSVRAKAYFEAEMPAWGEFVAQLSIDPFTLPEASDIKWVVNNAAIDFSDTKNPTGIKFPDNYDSPHIANGVPSETWRGFYLNELSVTLPNKFSNGNDPITAGVSDVIIDDMGFTGKAFLSPILSLENGSLGGWAFSIDTFQLSVIANKLAGGQIRGLINVPILSKGAGADIEEDDCMRYVGTIEAGNKYSFAVSPNGTFKANLWKADIILDANSHILIEKVEEEFHACATMHGKIKFDGELKPGMAVKVPDVGFKNLVIRNKEPYFSPGEWDVPLAIGAQFGGFGLNIKGFDVRANPDDSSEGIVGVNIAIRLNDDEPEPGQPAQQESDKPSLTAIGAIDLIGELTTVNGKQKWTYKDFDVNSICIEAANMPGIKSLEGCLAFFDEADFDPTATNWGTGFRGMLKARFDIKSLGEVEAQVVGQFGRITAQQEFKYFMIDGMLGIPEGLELGGMLLHGFGGGVTYHMTKSGGPNPLENNVSSGPIPNLGVSLSGIPYTPDITKSIGISASVCMSLAKEEAFNFNATLGAEFNTAAAGGGFSKIYFAGTARAMAPVKIGGDIAHFPNDAPPAGAPPPSDAPFRAYLDLEMDFNSGIFDGDMQVYLNYQNKVLGVGENDLFGHLEIRLGDENWYVNLGKPSAPAGFKISVPGIGDAVKLTAYFNIGTDLEPMPDLPAYVAELTGAGNFMAGENERASGQGFAFGAALDIDTGNMDFLIFYARLKAGLGFDIMLQKFTGAVCANLGNAPLGMNGWYAAGQAWAYVQGDLGIKVKLFGAEKRFEIISLAAGVALQAKLPNPFYARGAVGGRYSIMGGLFSGECNFQVEIGEQCQLEGGGELLPAFPIYAEVIPAGNSSDVDLLTSTEIVFGMEVNTPVEYDGALYKIVLDYAELRTENDQLIYTDNIWSADYRSLQLRPHSAMPANTNITMTANVLILKRPVNSYAWTEIGSEDKVSIFTTGDDIDYIPEANVEFSYPMNGQFNFYPEEYIPVGAPQGYIDLVISQPGLFYNIPEGKFLNVKFKAKGGDWVYAQNVEHDIAGNRVTFIFPSGGLVRDKFYTAKLVYADAAPEPTYNISSAHSGRPTPPASNPPPPPSQNAPSSGQFGGFGGLNTTAVADGVADSQNAGNSGPVEDEHVLYEWNFRTSEYATFDEKIEAFEATASGGFVNNKVGFKLKANDFEPFDLFEISGAGAVAPMLNVEYGGGSDPWLYPRANFNLYRHLPMDIVNIDVDRPIDKRLPTWAVVLSSDYTLEYPVVAYSWGDVYAATVLPHDVRLSLNPFLIATNDLEKFEDKWNSYLINETCVGNTLPTDVGPQQSTNCEDDIDALVNEIDNSVIYKFHNQGDIPLSAKTGTYKVMLNYILPGGINSSTKTIQLIKS